MELIIIAAIGEMGELGKDNQLLWKLPNDMKFFAETTMGYPVIMGRKTYESIPKKYRPLKGRINIVLSKTKDFSDEGAVMYDNLDYAISHAISCDAEKAFIIGGDSVYSESIKLVDKMLLTHVIGYFADADTFFPYVNSNKWVSKEIINHDADDKHEYAFQIVEWSRVKEE